MDSMELDCSWNVDGYPEVILECGWDIFDANSTAYISKTQDFGWDITAETISNYIDSQWEIRNYIKTTSM